VFFLFRVGGVIFCFSSLFPMCPQHVLIMFSKGSQVFNVFPSMFPIAPWFYCIWFAQSSTLLYKLHYREIRLFLFCNWGSKEVLPLGSAQYSKKVIDGPMNMALAKKKKKSYGCTHELINTNHTMSSQLQLWVVNNFAMTSLLFTLTHGNYICYVRLLYHLGLLCYKILIVIHLFAYYSFI